jgi:ribosomal protein S18 acetylase RimI-like enzyme
MTTSDILDTAARAWLTTVAAIADALPGGVCEASDWGSAFLATGAPLASVNGVFDINTTPRADRIAELAKRAADELEVPWSIQVRAEPDAEIAGIAAGYGLTRTSLQPFMIKELVDREADREPARGELVIRQVDGNESDAYTAALAAGFQALVETMRLLGSPEVLDMPCAVGYLAEVDGVAVGTALALRADDCVGVFNISVAPEYRRRGYGKALTAAAVRAEQGRGARTAFLHSSEIGFRVYESLGFRLVEQWTQFVR